VFAEILSIGGFPQIDEKPVSYEHTVAHRQLNIQGIALVAFDLLEHLIWACATQSLFREALY
jgi:hypothetical protein